MALETNNKVEIETESGDMISGSFNGCRFDAKSNGSIFLEFPRQNLGFMESLRTEIATVFLAARKKFLTAEQKLFWKGVRDRAPFKG